MYLPAIYWQKKGADDFFKIRFGHVTYGGVM